MANRSKRIRDYDILIQSHIDKKNFVKIIRTFNEIDASISGFILAMSRDFLLFQVNHEFSFNGYAIIRKDQFDSLRCNEFDKKSKEIYKKEGLLTNGYGINNNIQLTSWQSIFKGLKKNDYHVIVECQDKEEPLFEIGPIKRVSQNSVSMQYYNPAGLLENKLTPTKYADITIITFGDNYTKTFRKYLKPSKQVQ
jgi:hypothetical protein